MFPIIYVVDDEPAIRDSMRLLLESTGFRVETFEDAESFQRAFEHESAGCVLMDVRMPRIGGLDTLRWLRASGSLVPVLMISGHADVPTATRAMIDGATDFFQKPFNQQTLLDRVNQAVRMQEAGLAREREKRTLAKRFDSLSLRERDILDRLISGGTSASIAAQLGLSRRTVEMHRANILKKTGVDSFAELVRCSTLLGIVGSGSGDQRASSPDKNIQS